VEHCTLIAKHWLPRLWTVRVALDEGSLRDSAPPGWGHGRHQTMLSDEGYTKPVPLRQVMCSVLYCSLEVFPDFPQPISLLHSFPRPPLLLDALSQGIRDTWVLSQAPPLGTQNMMVSAQNV
jgi:hypothetical protein